MTPPFPQPYGWVLQNRDIADEDAEQYSLEARLASPADAKVQWVAGLYLFDESVDRTERFITQFSLLPAAGGDVTFGQDVDSTSYAAFGQLTYPVTEQLQRHRGPALLGRPEGRAPDRRVNNVPDRRDARHPAVPRPAVRRQRPATRGTRSPASSASTTAPTAANLLYASVSSGLKSGIFPSQNNVVQNVGEATPAEEVWNYEAGAKSQWLDNTLRANFALFYMDYSDLQLFRLDPQLRLLTFTEDTTNYGAEFEFLAAPDEGVEVGFNARLPEGRGERRRERRRRTAAGPGILGGRLRAVQLADVGRQHVGPHATSSGPTITAPSLPTTPARRRPMRPTRASRR